MAQVSATEAIAAITAVAGAEKSEWQPVVIGAAPETSRHLQINMNCGSSCSHCHGQGSKVCSMCHGKQQLLVYINLTVKW